MVNAFWNYASQHWVWANETIIRHLCSEFEFTSRYDDKPIDYDDYDLVHFWYTTSTPKDVPLEKLVIVAHSQSGAQRFQAGAASQGVLSKWLQDRVAGQPTIVNYGIDTDIFQPLYKEKSDKLRFGFVGNEHDKNFELIKPLQSDDRLEIIPSTPRCIYGMPSYYATIDVLLVSSLSEGFGRPILEAAACGIPIISTDVGVAKDIIGTDGGIVIDLPALPREETNASIQKDYFKAVEYMLAHPTKRKQMGKRNRQEVLDNWTWEKKIKPWSELLWEGYENSKK